MKSNILYRTESLNNENSIFITFYNSNFNSNYKKAINLGHKEGISGSTGVGYNLGISKYIDKENIRKAAIEAFKYITSKEVQRKLVMKGYIFSIINSLYEEEDLCKKVDCEFFRRIQLVGRTVINRYNYDYYTTNYRKYVFDFVFGNNSISDTLKKIENLTKIYSISIDTKDSAIGLIYLCFVSTLSFLMCISLIFLFKKNYNSYFSFLPNDFWILSIIGSIIILYIELLDFNQITIEKCCMKITLLSLGFTFSLVPVLYKLIINFPIENKISDWTENHKYIFLFIFLILDLSTLLLHFMSSYIVYEKKIDEGKNFKICQINKDVGYVILNFSMVSKMVILITILVLIYIEWNMEETYYDLRFLIISIYSSFLTIILIIIVSNVIIENYVAFFSISALLYILLSVINYSCLYGIRVIWGLLKKDNNETLFIKNVNKNFLESKKVLSSTVTNNNDQYSKSSTKSNINTNNNINNNNNSNSNSNSNNNNSKELNTELTTVSSNTGMERRTSNIPQLFLKVYNYHISKAPASFKDSLDSDDMDINNA